MGILIFSRRDPYKRGNVNNQFSGKAIFFLVRKYVMGASRTILRLLVSEERQSSYEKVLEITDVFMERSGVKN